MKVTLRKAASLQGEIRNLLSEDLPRYQIPVNEFTQDVAQEIAKARAELDSVLVSRAALHKALFEIRQNVAIANAQSGVSDSLAQLALLESTARDLALLTREKAQRPLAETVQRLEKLREGDNVHYSQPVLVSLLTEADLEQCKAELLKTRRKIREIKDQLLALNTTTSTLLSSDTVETLQKAGLL